VPQAPVTSVLVVDDEPMVREVVARYLELDGHQVLQCADGAAARELLEARDVDLVVLDVMLPQLDGLTLLRQIRSRGDVPVLLLTAKGDEGDRLLGLELGADDYVVKPFSAREVVARVRTILRRATPPTAATAQTDAPPAELVAGELRIDTAARVVTVAGLEKALTAKEFDLLAFLAGSPRQVFSRAQLLELVWDSSAQFQDPATVTVHLGRLRQKIEPDPEHPRWLTTVWGVGYRFDPAG
jgi:DNA-binding response OmpR family regulator